MTIEQLGALVGLYHPLKTISLVVHFGERKEGDPALQYKPPMGTFQKYFFGYTSEIGAMLGARIACPGCSPYLGKLCQGQIQPRPEASSLGQA